MKITSYHQDHDHQDIPPLAAAILREEPSWRFDPFGGDEDDDEDRKMEQFLHYLRTIESEPTSTLARQLIADGIELPPPQSFTEPSVHSKLWEVIHGLARRRNYLYHTDHLSDLELYRHLWEITLNQPAHELDDRMGECACHLDLVSDGCDESIWLWLRYYADEETRLDWAADFPGDPLPDRLSPPYDRDRHLPEWSPASP